MIARLKTALDPTAQLRLFGKLKLPNCANCVRAGNRAGLLFGASRRDQDLPPRAKVLPTMIPAIVFRIDIHCYLRSIAAPVLVFAREFPRPSQNHCSLQ
jgi:hypothetical protein